MPFRDDPRIDRLETLAARISRMFHAADDVFTRQRGNLRHEDRELLREFYGAYGDYLTWLRQERNRHMEPTDPHDLLPSTGWPDTPAGEASHESAGVGPGEEVNTTTSG